MKISGGGKASRTVFKGAGFVKQNRYLSWQFADQAKNRGQAGQVCGNDGWDKNSAAEVEKTKQTLWLLRNMH